MENSKIAWCDHTVNLWWGCYEVNKACDNCYAKQKSNRFHNGDNNLWQQQGPRMYIKSAMDDILRYQARAAKEGVVYRIFINSMSDLFERSMPVVDFKHQPMHITDVIPKGFTTDDFPGDDNILQTKHLRIFFFDVVRRCPNLFFILLTKRPSNIVRMIPSSWMSFPPANVIYMTSCPDQESLDTLLPQLLDVPGRHGLSLEPLIDKIDIYSAIRKYHFKKYGSFHTTWFADKLQWVIVGGESGFNARPMLLKWASEIQRQCATAGVAYFLKQDSQANEPKRFREIEHFPVDMQVRQFPVYEHDRATI